MCLAGITGGTLLAAAAVYMAWIAWHSRRLSDERYKIAAIVQTGPEKEALKTSYLAELLGLSSDKPAMLYAFDLKEARRKLLACPLISEAKVARVPPATIYVDYTVRKPIAWLVDYENIGLDRDGYLFPIAPFFTPKHLPEIYLGLPPFGAEADGLGRKGGSWQTPVQNKHLRLAFEILQVLKDAPWREGLRIKRIDVSNAFSSSYGQREIVLFTEEEAVFRDQDKETVCLFPKILRLPQKDYARQLGNFLSLRKAMLEDYQKQIHRLSCETSPVRFAPRIIDLRIPQLAFVQNSKESP